MTLLPLTPSGLEPASLSRRLRRTGTLAATGVALAALVALGAACSSDDDAEPAVPVNVEASNFTFAIDGTFTPGVNQIAFTNAGDQTHHGQLVRLDEGKTSDDLVAAVASGAGALPEWAHEDGGPGAIDPGESVTYEADLEAGNYAIICVIPDPADGVPHIAKGMMVPFTVEGDESSAEASEADVDISAGDYTFGDPVTVDAGEHVIALKNEGKEVHELAIVALNDGATTEQFLAAMNGEGPAGPPPGKFVGGVQGIQPGATGTSIVDLPAGQYALLCFFPNAEGVPHFALGMVGALTVE